MSVPTNLNICEPMRLPSSPPEFVRRNTGREEAVCHVMPGAVHDALVSSLLAAKHKQSRNTFVADLIQEALRPGTVHLRSSSASKDSSYFALQVDVSRNITAVCCISWMTPQTIQSHSRARQRCHRTYFPSFPLWRFKQKKKAHI